MDGMDALGRKEGAAGTGRDEHDRMLGGTGGGRRVELVAATNERQQNLAEELVPLGNDWLKVDDLHGTNLANPIGKVRGGLDIGFFRVSSSLLFGFSRRFSENQ